MGSPDKVKAPKQDLGADGAKWAQALGTSLPQFLELEQQYRPQFGELNLADSN